MPAVTIHTRQISHTPCATGHLAGATPWNAANRLSGAYGEAYENAGDIWFRYCYAGRPPFAWEVQVTTGVTLVGGPRFAWDPAHQDRIRMVYARTDGTTDVVEIASDDGGQTWSGEEVQIANATRPTIAIGPYDGTLLIVAYSSHTLKALRLYGGQDPASPTSFTLKDNAGVNLDIEDDGFHLTQGADGTGRWLLVARKTGASNTTTFWSGDDAETWTEFS